MSSLLENLSEGLKGTIEYEKGTGEAQIEERNRHYE
jgi:hypothetical protein